MKTSILVVALCLLSTVAHSADSYKWREFAEEGLTNKRTAEEQLYADKKYKREVIVRAYSNDLEEAFNRYGISKLLNTYIKDLKEAMQPLYWFSNDSREIEKLNKMQDELSYLELLINKQQGEKTNESNSDSNRSKR